MTAFELEKKLHNQYENEKGDRVDYDVCGCRSLEETSAFYGDKYEHVFSGFVTYHNGVRNVWHEEHHFFIRKP